MNSSAKLPRVAAVAPEIVAAEAVALSALWERFVASETMAGRTVSQAAFGADHDIGSQGMVWQYLNGHRALNIEAASKFAHGLNTPISAFSPRLAAIARSIAEVAGDSVSPEIDAALVMIRSLLSNDPSARERARDLVALLNRPAVTDSDVEQRMPITRKKKPPK